MEFRGQLWLQHTQIWIQSGLFALCLAGLALSVAALWRPRSPRFHRMGRTIWFAAMMGFFALWLGGATLEMMHRAAPISRKGLFVGLGAFSIFIAGTLSLASDCFDEKHNLRPGRIVLTLLALTFAGCVFGGFALPWNAWFEAGHNLKPLAPLPKGWMLALCGAQLLTVAHTLEPDGDATAAVRSPREASIWLLGFIGLLMWWTFDNNRLVALAAYAGFVPFLIRAWSARLIWKRRGEITVWLASSLVFVALIIAFRRSFTTWQTQFMASWLQWPLVIEAGVLTTFSAMLWRMPVNFSLRLATRGSVVKAALLLGTLSGAIVSMLLFGPTGALWWSFWPLAGLFFDLLQVDDDHERKWRRLAALKRNIRSDRRCATTGRRTPHSADSPSGEREDDEPVELSTAGRPVEER